MKTQLEKWITEAPEIHFKQAPPVKISAPKTKIDVDAVMNDFEKHFPTSAPASKKDYSNLLNDLK
jgi:hypothetical protein